MIVGELKLLEEIIEMIEGHRPLLVLACGGCTSICLAGGQREALQLEQTLREKLGEQGKEFDAQVATVERQCNENYFFELDDLAPRFAAILSTACGAGVQFVAERYPQIPVLPALNTSFVGYDRDVGWYEENCRTCGDCVLGDTGGICPVTRCAKSLFNGPCGGTRVDGNCEVDPDIPCAWYLIHERLKGQGRLELITKVRPAREWRNQIRRTIIQPEYRHRYAK